MPEHSVGSCASRRRIKPMASWQSARPSRALPILPWWECGNRLDHSLANLDLLYRLAQEGITEGNPLEMPA